MIKSTVKAPNNYSWAAVVLFFSPGSRVEAESQKLRDSRQQTEACLAKVDSTISESQRSLFHGKLAIEENKFNLEEIDSVIAESKRLRAITPSL